MIKDKFMLHYLEWDVFNKLKTLTMLHWDWKHFYNTAILSCPSFLSLCKSFLPKHACVVLPTEMGEMDKKKTWKNIHLCSRLLCFTHMCCSIHRQLTTAQLCTTDAIRGLEEGLKCCEQKYPTLLLTQANHCG